MRERMEFHGGGMTVKSEPDDGTTITAYIPVSRDNDLPVTVISG
jgi:two-component system NarL family sensor kinase